ncbi:hypothetical protein [Streptomyces antimycoticus]|uniref:hypothetical protein n=1 Tax=Streptomyces antimycoticus TaxID=68175 RepID=UPI0036EFF41C
MTGGATSSAGWLLAAHRGDVAAFASPSDSESACTAVGPMGALRVTTSSMELSCRP